MPDLNALTLQQVFGLLAAVTLVDVGFAIVTALAKGTFSLGAVAIWLQSHVLVRVFVIFALAVLGHGVGTDGEFVPPIPAAFGLALIGLGAYVLETIASMKGTLDNPTRPNDTEPSA